MNCKDFNNAFLNADNRPLSPQEQAHLDSCPRCQRMFHVLNTTAAEEPSQDILNRIEERLTTGLTAVKPMPKSRTLVFLLLLVFFAGLALMVFYRGTAGLRAMSLTESAVILLLLLASSLLLARSLVSQVIPGSKHAFSPRQLTVSALGALLLAAVVLFPRQEEAHFWRNAWVCFRGGVEIGIFAAIPSALVLRRGVVLSWLATGVSLGLLGGLLGMSVLEIHCPNLDLWHILAGHLGAAFACTLVGLSGGFVARWLSDSEALKK